MSLRLLMFLLVIPSSFDPKVSSYYFWRATSERLVNIILILESLASKMPLVDLS